MTLISWFLLATTIISLIAFTLLGREALKKLTFTTSFLCNGGYLKALYYDWPGRKTKEMRKIALESDKPFDAMIGFRLRIRIPLLNFSAVDYFGYIVAEKISSGKYRAVISTFMWKRRISFVIQTNSDGGNVRIVKDEESQKLTPGLVCPQHFWQQFGIY